MCLSTPAVILLLMAELAFFTIWGIFALQKYEKNKLEIKKEHAKFQKITVPPELIDEYLKMVADRTPKNFGDSETEKTLFALFIFAAIAAGIYIYLAV